MTQRIDRIAQLLNCPVKGEEMRRAITEARKDYLLEDDEDEDDESSAESDLADDAAPET
ncbi:MULTISPECIES: hypothetical protein [Pseudomonas]|uniref:hypothetical protein n=1 Tax=Pseudomonas TaxID=286 RepID=UPI0015B249F8|nr:MULTISPECIES: hypothetical protein [Pseudomonas]QXN50488.1 hypothetical protein KW062_01535 [Pseudomonas fluorescens]WSO24803.1 hypothetical protein VUJ50_01545 [Pseudomonas fluorescens]